MLRGLKGVGQEIGKSLLSLAQCTYSLTHASPPLGGGGTLAFEQERYPPQCTGAQAHNETRSRANKGQSLGVATLLWSAPAELDSATCVGPSHCIG